MPQAIKMGMWNSDLVFKRNFRWLFSLDNIIRVPEGSTLDAKPPSKAQRPNLSFKEIPLEHQSETVYMPGKSEWKPVSLTLYDTGGINIGRGNCRLSDNSIYKWIREFYWPEQAKYGFAAQGLKKTAFLTMYDGGGNWLEQWRFENAWPQDINFGELDYQDSGISTIDLALRYDRAYITFGGTSSS